MDKSVVSKWLIIFGLCCFCWSRRRKHWMKIRLRVGGVCKSYENSHMNKEYDELLTFFNIYIFPTHFCTYKLFSHSHWYTYLKTRCKVTFFSLHWTPPFNYRGIIKSGFLRNTVVFFRGNTLYLDTFWREDVSIWCVPSSHARWWALESWLIIFKFW